MKDYKERPMCAGDVTQFEEERHVRQEGDDRKKEKKRASGTIAFLLLVYARRQDQEIGRTGKQ